MFCHFRRPGMNRCSVPEEETSNALRAQVLHHPSASVQRNQINNSLGTSITVPSVQTHNDNKQESLVNCSDTGITIITTLKLSFMYEGKTSLVVKSYPCTPIFSFSLNFLCFCSNVHSNEFEDKEQTRV